jgi:V/A-type H+-transporting ATPase subunit F
MYKIGIIGERDSVLGFMSLGFSVHEAKDTAEAAKTLHTIVSTGEYAVIFVVEHYAEKIAEDIAKYRDNALPAIISLPGQSGNTGYGLNAIKNAVERAVGTDIVFKDK